MGYLDLRMINEETRDYFNITEIKINGENFVKIPYKFNEDKTKSVNYNLRIAEKTKDNKYNNDFLGEFKNDFFNINKINWNEDLYICIGEFNAMVLWQLGYKNVIGLNTNNIENSNFAFKKYSDKFKIFKYQNAKLFLVQSNTGFGRSMSKVVKKCLPHINIVDIKKYGEFKDANELLIQSDNKVHMLLRSFFCDMEVINLSNFNMDELYQDFSPKISWGIDWLNKKFNGIQRQKVTIVTGPTCHGKSVLTNQIVLNALNDDSGQRVLIVDGEESIADRAFNLHYPLVANVVGEKEIKNYVDTVQDGFIDVEYVDSDTTKKIQLWHKNKLFLYSSNYSEKELETDLLFEKLKESVMYEGINVVIIDNLMSLNNDNKRDTLEKEFNFVKKCQQLAKRFDCAVVLCSHLKKYDDIEKVTFSDICGNNKITALVDSIVLVYRNDDMTKSYLKILKNRKYGKFGKCEVVFNNKLFNEYDPIGKLQYKKTFDTFIPFLKPDEKQKIYMEEIENMEQQILNF